MSDLSDLQAAQTVKIAGANSSTGVESYYADVTSAGKLSTAAEITPLVTATQTVVALSSASWTALPTTALSGRKSIAIQNQSGAGAIVMVNFTGTGSAGWQISNLGGRTLAVNDSVTVYGQMVSGSGSVLVEELA